MASRMVRLMVRLTWLDEGGEPYHTQDLSPRTAKDLLKRNGIQWVDFPGEEYGCPLSRLSRAAVAKSRRAVIGRKGSANVPAVMISLPEDN